MPEAAASYKLYTIPLNNIVIELDAGLDVDEKLAQSVSLEFGPITKRMFNVDRFASLTFPSDEELAEMRKPPDPALLPS